MERGAYRPTTAQQAARTAASRPAQAQHREEPKAAASSPAAHSKPSAREPKKRKILLPIVIGVAVLLLAGLAWLIFPALQSGAPGVDTSKYQAVFFTNGQVYFGKLHASTGNTLRLTEIYYLQAKNTTETDAKDPQKASSDSDAQLIKLGAEVHGPEDEMIINRDQVLFYENLKSDGKVAQAIASHTDK